MSVVAEARSLLRMNTPAAVTKELIRREFIVDYRPGAGVRISPHFYTTDDELELVIKEMKKIRRQSELFESRSSWSCVLRWALSLCFVLCSSMQEDSINRSTGIKEQSSKNKAQLKMPNNYGDNPPLSYNKYLRVQDLINLAGLSFDSATSRRAAVHNRPSGL